MPTSTQSIPNVISSNYNLYNLTGYTLTTSGNIGLSNITTSPYYNGTIISTPYNSYTYTDVVTPENPLKKLKYIVDFDHSIDKFYLLEDNIKGIRKNKFLFNCHYEGNRIQPYELIMKLIETQEKFSVKVHISDVLSICYTNFQFVKIENNLNFNNDCDFSELKVKFKYEKIKYENHKLSEKELRTDKLKKIIANNE